MNANNLKEHKIIDLVVLENKAKLKSMLQKDIANDKIKGIDIIRINIRRLLGRISKIQKKIRQIVLLTGCDHWLFLNCYFFSSCM